MRCCARATVRGPGLAAALAACAALAGCGGLRVTVVDGQSGRAISHASVSVSVRGTVVSRAETGGGGGASLAAPEDAVITVSARGYASWGAPLDAAGTAALRIALEPSWVDSFLEDKRTVGADAPSSQFTTPRRCPCDPPAR